VEFLRAATGEPAMSLAVLNGEDDSMAPRERSLAEMATTLTAQPWAFASELPAEVRRQGFDQGQVEAAVGVISMFNYFTRVADASGIEFDYQTPLPAFQPDMRQDGVPRPGRSVASHPAAEDRPAAEGRPQPEYQRLQATWQSWRSYLLESDKPLSQRQRRLLASVAAEEATDWEAAEALSVGAATEPGDDQLIEFSRKLSLEPWRMEAANLDKLRASGLPEQAVLHAISVVAHQNADSRLAIGLRVARQA
jgi:hypothetical protein